MGKELKFHNIPQGEAAGCFAENYATPSLHIPQRPGPA
jgi:hypothetical protein